MGTAARERGAEGHRRRRLRRRPAREGGRGGNGSGQGFLLCWGFAVRPAPYLVLGLFDSWAGIDTGLSASVDF